MRSLYTDSRLDAIHCRGRTTEAPTSHTLWGAIARALVSHPKRMF
ncbi:MAG: hypothetical protein SAL70_08175 [Scytonema sp. PMC 1070.18]|nr:hypothetical protein [Scytonema sp. PMC 1070.18]